jgi:Carboxypeptidase regulatory-like domain
MSMTRISFIVLCIALGSAMLPARPGAGSITGSITGKVTLDGTPAKPVAIDMSKEPECAKQHTTPVMTENVVVGSGNALENVVVYISQGAPDEDGAPTQPATIVQKGCQYLPHVVPMMVNQELRIENADPLSHNIHPLAKINHEWNRAQPAGTPALTEKFEKAEFIPVKCNVHAWMHTTFAVMKTSHYAVTGENGTFRLPDLPPGKYTLTAWHESYGTKSQDVSITGEQAQNVDFNFKARPY